MSAEQKAYVDERMKRWRATAQCQCASHNWMARVKYEREWDSMKVLEEIARKAGKEKS